MYSLLPGTQRHILRAGTRTGTKDQDTATINKPVGLVIVSTEPSPSTCLRVHCQPALQGASG